MDTTQLNVCHLSSGHEYYELRIFQKECSSLAKRFAVTLIIPKVDCGYVNNVKTIPFKKYSSTLGRFLFAPVRMYFMAKGIHAGVYHFHDPELIFTGILLKLTTKAKVIYDVHEDVAGSIRTRKKYGSIFSDIISVLFSVFEKHAARCFDSVICATDRIAVNFKGYCAPEAIYNYPIMDKFIDEGACKDGSIVVFGNMSVVRGITQVCEAMRILNEDYGQHIKLRLVGQISPQSMEYKILKNYGEYIEYTGWMDIEEAYKLVQKSVIGLVTYLPAPNHDHCMPNKMFEYMNYGMPVICSRFEEMRNIVEKNGCGICVDPENSTDIAKALCDLIENPEKMKTMGENGKRVVRDNYNWRVMENRLYHIYNSL